MSDTASRDSLEPVMKSVSNALKSAGQPTITWCVLWHGFSPTCPLNTVHTGIDTVIYVVTPDWINELCSVYRCEVVDLKAREAGGRKNSRTEQNAATSWLRITW